MAGDLEQGEEDKPKPGCCFPCEPFSVCGPLCCCLPVTWSKIQDGTHLILVLGVFSCLVLIVKNVYVVVDGFKCFSAEGAYCVPESGSVIFALLLATYVMGIISQWDEQLLAKEEMCKAQKQKLLNSYNELLSDMDGLLSNATESASGLAERSFESKRRDFQRFLERAKTRFTTVIERADEMQMLTQFRKFCIHWLSVFRECSIDPVNNPTEVVTAEELESCVSIVEVADKCLDRLRITEVRFISGQREKDKKELEGQQKVFRRHTVRQGPRMLSIEAGGASGTKNEAPPTGSMDEGIAKPKIRASWIRCGGVGFECNCSTYPGACSVGCCGLTFLSKEHSMLIFAFFVGVAVFALETYRLIDTFLNPTLAEGAEQNTELAIRVASVFLVSMAMWCAVVVLCKFEEIDTVHKLEREVQDLKDQNTAVGEQREKMKQFWSSAQNLTELWLYRTVPRLDLYKELHSQLEDESEEDLLTNITGANNALEMLENNLGALEAWRNDGALKTEDKKLFGKTINELCQMGHMGDILIHLTDDVIKGQVMYKLKNLPTN